MKQQRGHWNRGQWTRKTNVVESAELSLSTKNSSKQNAAKDDSSNWTDTGRVDNSIACWDAQAFDAATFFDENRKIFQWDDCGAAETLKKAEVKLGEGLSTPFAEFEQEAEQFLASVDWDTRWSCSLAECAEVFTPDKKKNLKGTSSSPVIIGLPGAKDDNSNSATPSLHLPLDFMPAATGWDEAVEDPAVQEWEDSPMEQVATTNLATAQVFPPSQVWDQPLTSENAVTGLGCPQVPSSYRYITPSGWEDVQADPPVVSSGRGDLLADVPVSPSGWEESSNEPRSDMHMQQQGCNGWGDSPSQDPISNGSGWGHLYPSVESREVYGNSHPGKHQDNRNNSYKNGCWKPKRGSDYNNHESSGRRNPQRPGRAISTMYRVNHDPRPNRASRWESSRQWQSASVLAHGT